MIWRKKMKTKLMAACVPHRADARDYMRDNHIAFTEYQLINLKLQWKIQEIG